MPSAFSKYLWLTFLAVAISFTIFCVSKSSPVVGKNDRNDNSDKFHLWTTNLSHNYTFTYDPHAADEWLFHAGAPVKTNQP
jgi:hypothetical protein